MDLNLDPDKLSVEFNQLRSGYVVVNPDDNGLTVTVLSRGYRDKSDALEKLEAIKLETIKFQRSKKCPK